MLETGLGGRADATNIIDTPEAAAIASISLDHTAILGDTYAKIAFEKAGIIKKGGDVVLYPVQDPVSYTHLDVYKRQSCCWIISILPCNSSR